jgi:hypothetical protein
VHGNNGVRKNFSIGEIKIEERLWLEKSLHFLLETCYVRTRITSLQNGHNSSQLLRLVKLFNQLVPDPNIRLYSAVSGQVYTLYKVTHGGGQPRMLMRFQSVSEKLFSHKIIAGESK